MFYEKLQELSKKTGKSFAVIERDLGLPKNSITIKKVTQLLKD